MKKLLAWFTLCAVLLMGFGALAEFDDTEFEFSDFADSVTMEEGFDEEFDEAFDDDGSLVEDSYTDAQLHAAMEAGTFSVNFDDGGYIGEWTSVEDLSIEFFLPDGWTAGEGAEDEAFFAENEDGSVQLGINQMEAAYDGTDLAAWAQENVIGDYSIGLANHQEAVLSIDNEIGRVLVLMPTSDGRVIAFSFFRTSPDALSDARALEIAGTCTDLWG